jgi:nucleoside-diphosphate-sugar epimerase
MRIFVTGASGFVGTAVVQNLLGRSDAWARAIAAAGAEPHRGALDDLASLRAGAAASDGVIHTAFIHDFSNIAASGEVDVVALGAIGDALAGSNRPFVVTSAIGVLSPGKLSREADAPDPSSPGKHRLASEHATRALAARGVRASLIRLPPSVHDAGDHGFVPALIQTARTTGVSAYIGDGHNRWSAVHRLDAAALFRCALERGRAGSVYHAVADEGIATRDLAAVIGERLGVPVVSTSAAEASAQFSWLAKFFALDCPASSANTRAELDWQPRHAGLLADLAHDHYFTT